MGAAVHGATEKRYGPQRSGHGAAVGDRVGRCGAAQWAQPAGPGVAGVGAAAVAVASGSAARCCHQCRHAARRSTTAGFGLTEVLVSAVILAMALMGSLRCWGALTVLEQQRRSQTLLLDWMELQLQRDQGLLHHQARHLDLDCANPDQSQQGLQSLQAAWQQSALLPPPAGASVDASLEPAGAGLLLQLMSGEHQRGRFYSLQGLGACLDEPA